MPEARLEAVIWDMDGVIADTGIYHCRAWQDVFRKRGAAFTDEDFRRHFGQRNDTIIRSALGEGISPEEREAIAAEKEANYRRRIAGNIRPLPGAVKLVKSLQGQGIKSAIASSAPQDNIRMILEGLKIKDHFQAIAWGWEVSEGKPNPQIFLLAAKKLGVEPANCVVIEDAVAGVAGAKSAGMRCVAVANSHPRESLKEADIVVDTLEAVSVSVLAGLFTAASRPAANKNQELKNMERSLVLIKPDAMARNLTGAIIARLEAKGLRLLALRMLHVDRPLAERHYAVHRDKPFYEDLVSYITSTPIVAAVFEGEGAVALIRKVMGATDPSKAEADTVRRDFGVDIQRNSTHASDSVENAEREIALFFPEKEIFG